MNIGMVCYPTQGGSGVVATELSKELAKRGHQVHLMSYSLPFRISQCSENVWFHKIEVSAYPLFKYPPYSLEVTAEIVDVAMKYNLDVVHAHYAIPHGISAWCARLILEEEGRRLPVITTLHGTDITIVGSEPSMAPVTRFLLKHSDVVTTVSESMRQETEQFFHVHCGIHVIPNFIDPAEFHRKQLPEFRLRLAEPEEKILLHMSNFRPVKNISHIVQAFAHVRRQLPARLVMIGDGPERPHAEEQARRLGVADKIHFMGSQANVIDYLSVADLYLQASQHESFGLSSLEAMACGVPAVAYRVGGVPEVILYGRTGFLVDPDDAAALGEAALAILSDGSRHEEFARASQERAVTEFGAERIVPHYEWLYEELAAGRHPCLEGE
jgi:N-acetyl-alpha-D-glucosaminyl L-malate synthase BshA